MTIPWPARFSDALGTESTTATGDGGPELRLRIRGFDFVGLPDDLRPVRPLPEDAPFTRSENGEVCDYTIEWRVPVALDDASGPAREGLLYIHVDENQVHVAALLRVEGAEYRSRWFHRRLDEALADIGQQLRGDLRLRICVSCGLSSYPDFSYFTGDLACFRDTPDEIRGRRGRLGTLWPRLTRHVSETHVCPRFEPGGSRAAVFEGEPNTWAAQDWDETPPA